MVHFLDPHFQSFMLGFVFHSRSLANVQPDRVKDFRQLLAVGDAVRAAAPIPVSLTNKPLEDLMKWGVLEQVERLTAELIERRAGANHETAGFCVSVKQHKPDHFVTKCTLTAEVTEVTPTEAMFQVDFLDANNGSVIGTAHYTRVVVAPPYKIKI
jgi:hypothetical protein